jgi:ribosomal protein L32|uniref:Large ribosomal subunit protein bL32c n=1 Tax=Tetraselmis sp. CCMP 881 TaxID=1812852 RepID=A0A142BY29_9CHLO|nr:ribosomal protein L32 [Tetraselmis sp. CCMP 881]AMP43358.1 ribosomal protein L32 [Tetraselmis sp. CCMP 881]
MAVPKKRTSKTKKNIRKTVWKQKTKQSALKALSLAKSTFNNPLPEKSEVKGFNIPITQTESVSDSETTS